MSPKITEAVASELKRFAQELELSDSQKEQLRTHLAENHAKIHDFLRQNPLADKTARIEKIRSIRSSMRERVVKFLNPEQLAKWDAAVARAKEFLGHSVSQ